MKSEKTTEDAGLRLAEADPDRRLAALFAPAPVRARLFALYAFNHEIARVSEAVSEPLIGDMRLTWWRDAVSALCAEAPQVRRHDVTEALAPFASEIGETALTGLIEARRVEVDGDGLSDVEACLAHADATAGALIRIAAALSGGAPDDALISACGRAWGLTGLLRAHPHRLAAGKPLLKPALVPALRDATASEIAGLKGRRFDAASFPALGYAALAAGYFRRLPEEPAATAPPGNPLLRQMRLLSASLSGRF